MQISAELNRRLHAVARTGRVSHEELKAICAKCGTALDFIDPPQAIKLIGWIEKRIKAGLVYVDGEWLPKPGTVGANPVGRPHNQSIERAGLEPAPTPRPDDPTPTGGIIVGARGGLPDNQSKVEALASELAARYDNRVLAMSRVVAVAIFKQATATGWKKAEVYQMAQDNFGTFFNRLSDAQGWFLYYLMAGDVEKMKLWKKKIEEEG